MELSLSTIEQFLIEKLPESEKLKKIEQLSIMFTRQRQNIDKYVWDKQLVSAYTSYFLLPNMQKLFFLLQQLPFSLQQELARCSLIDFGCGPGTYGIAWANFFASPNLNIFEYDQSELMLEQSKRLVQGLGLAGKWKWSTSLPTNLNRVCLLFGNSFNELEYSQFIAILEQIKPLFILFIEPGTKEVFKHLLTIRHTLVQRNYTIIYPCFSSRVCPMSDENWCHQIVKSTFSIDYESMCQRLRKDRRKQPVTLQLYRLGPEVGRENFTDCSQVRVIRLLKETKFSVIFEVCTEHMQENKLLSVEFLKRDFSKREFKQLVKLEWGSSIYIELHQLLAGNIWRATFVGDQFL